MSIYDTLNEQQREATFYTEGPLLLLAGAGSGKTRVLTHRIAYLIEQGLCKPWEIMAITFTNKAAREMRERVDKLIGHGGQDVWVSTFHSSCVRILRRHIDLIGYDKSFTIYDTDDSKKIIKEAMKQHNIDPKYYKEGQILSAISSAKNQLQGVKAYQQMANGDLRKEVYGRIYEAYQERLKKNNALDFDDLLFYTVELFRLRPDILEMYQDRFKYIMVDEYQDTNGVQFKLVSQLAGKHKNLCVVGDDDQSIYRFRGADIRNILDFEKLYNGTKVIKLEQNYRSTKTILEAANQVIKNNGKRKAKRLWTDNDSGNHIRFHHTNTEREEAQVVADRITSNVHAKGKAFSDHAILYRTNAQSRVLEEKLIFENIPYKIFGGTSFYQRREIKDMIAYLKVIDNSIDDLAVKRIINVPRRGIGATTIQKLDNYAQQEDISFFEAVRRAEDVPGLARASAKLVKFKNLINSMKTLLGEKSLVELIDELIVSTGYVDELRKDGTEESDGRIENINELVSKVAEYESDKASKDEEATLSGFLEEVALVAEIDGLDEDADYVALMTLHSAKGLEFPTVFITGLEDGVFPSYMSINSEDDAEIEEERRLCYVGITRAQKELIISAAKSRVIRGQTQYNPLSRYVKEIPEDLLEHQGVVSDVYSGMKVSSTAVIPKKRDKSFFSATPYQVKKQTAEPIPANNSISLEYKEGDLVKHRKFGVGEVLAIEPGGADFQVTVNFPSVGRKKLLAMLSGLKKM